MVKVGIPLKFKLSLVIFVLLLSSVGFYVYFAIDIFRKDKSADIYNNSLNSASQVAQELNSFLAQSNRSLKNLVNVSRYNLEKSYFKNYLQQEPHLFSITIFEKGEKGWSVKAKELDSNYLDLYKGSESDSVDIEKILARGEGVQFEQESSLPGWTVARLSQDKRILGIARIKADHLKQMISTSAELFRTKISKLSGQTLISLQTENANSYEGDIRSFVEQGSQQIVKKIKDSLVAFVKLKDFPLVVETSVAESKAFLAAEELQNKSIYFGSLIFSIVVIVAVLFARALTKNIQLLTMATEKVAHGEFETQLGIRSNDEIGVLAKSFEYMGKEILRYIEEMKEKSRLENEVKVAQLVQQTYFPADDEDFKNIRTAYQFRSASECGGDWWGYFKNGSHFYFMICDATGHGVPAALLTATASSAISTMKRLQESLPQLLTPSQMLKIFNDVVAELEGEVNLTALAGIIDLKSGLIKYANASHHPLWVITNEKEKVFKERIIPLMGETGSRIGEKKESTYFDHEHKLNSGDQILLLTDGILELENDEGKAFGQRRLIKLLEEFADLSLARKLEKVMESAMTFSNQKNGDDITLAMVEWTPVERESFKIKCSNSLKKINLVPTPDQNLEVEFVDIQEIEKSKEKIIISEEDLKNFSPHGNHILFSHMENDKNVEILKKYPINHLVGENSPYLFEELKLAIKGYNGDLLDLMSPSAQIHELEIQKGDEISKKIETFVHAHNFDEYFASPANYLHFMALELVNNIIMHGSIDKTVLTFIKNKNYVAIRVKDSIGSLDRDTIVSAIHRGYVEQKPKDHGPGAGLGLYLTYSQANQLWINRVPGKSTEIVCLIESNKRFKKYKERITSFHFIDRGNL